MRRIAQLAGVSTGAIYRYFPDKTSLFEELVAVPAKELKEQFEANGKRMDMTLRENITAYRQWVPDEPEVLVGYIYQHFDVFKLLLCRAKGTTYEGYVDSLIEIETQATLRFISYLRTAGIVTHDIDEELVHITVSAEFAGILEPIAHDMPKEQAIRYILILEEFYSAGWKKILRL
mgnify:CR=1 FL=1